MRSSILTELLEVSHIKSIRQIFISILVLLVLQVVITDLFETGTYVESSIVIRETLVFFLFSVDFFLFDLIRWNFSNLSECLRLWFCLFMSTCAIVYYCFHFWAYKRLSLIPVRYSLSDETEKLPIKSTALCKKNVLLVVAKRFHKFFIFQFYSIGLGWLHIVVILDYFYMYQYIISFQKIIQLLQELLFLQSR